MSLCVHGHGTQRRNILFHLIAKHSSLELSTQCTHHFKHVFEMANVCMYNAHSYIMLILTSLYHHFPIWAIKVQTQWKTLAKMNFFTCPPPPPKKKRRKPIIFSIENCMSTKHFLACPIWVTVISWPFKMLARIWLLLAPGNWASVYVAPCGDNNKIQT